MVGSTVSHYEVLERIGGGGMGVVYRARDLKVGRAVALKFLPPELTSDPEAKQRFMHEAQAASSLQYANVCVVHEIDETPEGELFIVMEFLEGESLRMTIDRAPLEAEQAVDLAIQTARGLQKAHAHGIAHRDIKPANVIVTAEGVAKIVDFGVAKLSGRTQLTRAGSTPGTAAYMSSEQIQGQRTDHRTDIRALGVMLYERISGKRPFDADYDPALAKYADAERGMPNNDALLATVHMCGDGRGGLPTQEKPRKEHSC